nr:hypothetical protein [Tanacetum cinerariifolium]
MLRRNKIDPNTSIGRLCLGESNQGLVAEGIENKKQWEGPKFQDTASSGQEREAKIFTFCRIEEEGERYFTPCLLNTRDMITSTFDGVCHQTFCAAKTSLNTKESDSDDEEDYGIQRNRFGAPIKICVSKKVVGFLGSFPVPLQQMEWKPDYKGTFCKKEEGDGQWHAKIRLTDH